MSRSPSSFNPARPRLLIVDLEATCWDRGKHRPGLMETIEIGAVLVDAEHLELLSSFERLVRPVRRPVLSEFCTGLTGIRQEDVQEADRFPDVFHAFLEWMGDPAGLTFASWGEYDRKQFHRDCGFHRVRYPFGARHFNIKKFFAEQMLCTRRGLTPALASLGLEFEGPQHRGLSDARNTLRVLRAVMRLHPGETLGFVTRR
jgi:inhibitor of KinA sporulation pathway (predicted exonuclease)